jgi:hypothetical protein
MTLITYPQTDEKVDLKSNIGGFVTKKGAPLQVYVLANDDKWYLQKPVIFMNRFWTCNCTFGDMSTKVGDSFFAAVVESDKRPQSPINDLLEEIVDYVRVQRGRFLTKATSKKKKAS